MPSRNLRATIQYTRRASVTRHAISRRVFYLRRGYGGWVGALGNCFLEMLRDLRKQKRE